MPSVRGQQSSDCLQHTVLVGIVDDRGAVPVNLTSKSFKATYGHRSVSSLETVYSEGPRRVVVLLDTSGSMRGPEATRYPKWQIARAAARSFFASLPSNSAADLMTFTDRSKVQAPLSVDHRLAEGWLDNDAADKVPSLRGRTAMYAAIEEAEKQLQPALPGDAIYIVTDGGDNSSRVSGPEVGKSLLASGVRLFAFLVVSSAGPRIAAEIDATNELTRLVTDSGGFMQIIWPKDVRLEQVGVPAYARTTQDPVDSGLALDTHTLEQIKLHADLLSRWISAFYLLTFQTPDGSAKPKHFKVKIVDSQGHPRKDLTIAYSYTLPACASVPAPH
ncbi:MAG: vWA domain-containing protein [Candidatus Sulfotelmatobacter sp.]